jgi:hypothetical protein
MSHECVIGLIHYCEGSMLITLPKLKEYIQTEIIEFNALCRIEGYIDILHRLWTLRDYADWRKSTNLTRFNYCPECGQKIDWGAIRKEAET